MSEEMTTAKLIQHTQEMLDEAEDDYVSQKWKVEDMKLELLEEQEKHIATLDLKKEGLTSDTKLTRYLNGRYVERQKEINSAAKEKDENYYIAKQLKRRLRFLMERFRQERNDELKKE